MVASLHMFCEAFLLAIKDASAVQVKRQCAMCHCFERSWRLWKRCWEGLSVNSMTLLCQQERQEREPVGEEETQQKDDVEKQPLFRDSSRWNCQVPYQASQSCWGQGLSPNCSQVPNTHLPVSVLPRLVQNLPPGVRLHRQRVTGTPHKQSPVTSVFVKLLLASQCGWQAVLDCQTQGCPKWLGSPHLNRWWLCPQASQDFKPFG